MIPHPPDADSVPSPCNSVCQIDAVSGYCRGCYRTLDEISFWVTYTSVQKRTLLDVLAERRRQDEEAKRTP